MNKIISDHQNEFDIYYEYLIQENQKFNLTAITQKDEVYIKHFEDSLVLGEKIDLNSNLKLCDIGSGAGFPAIPLKICYSQLEITIIEPTLKRVLFMKEVINKLNLQGITIICGRAEDLAIEYEEKFDIVCARAVAGLSPLLELLVKFSKIEGIIVAYKGDNAIEEINTSKHAIKELGCIARDIYHYELDNGLGNRNLVLLTKKEKTKNKYPRRYAEIKNKPL